MGVSLMKSAQKAKADRFEDSRLVKSRGESRKERSRDDRMVLSDRELTDSERLSAFRQSLFNAQLPDIPLIPGYHVCWLTTTNRNDPIHGRLRIGYELIKADDLPGWESISMKTGDYAGFVMVNEMIAAKISLKLFQAFATEVFHKQPFDEDGKLRQATEQAQAELMKRGLKPQIGDGTLALGSNDPGAPDFGRLHGETGRPYRPFEREKKLALQQALIDDDEDEDNGE
jgi:hypothetical protein